MRRKDREITDIDKIVAIIASARYMQSITDEMVQKSRYELLGSGKKDILYVIL